MATGKGGKGKPEGAIAKKETKAKSKAKTKAKAKPRTQDGSPIRDYLEGPVQTPYIRAPQGTRSRP